MLIYMENTEIVFIILQIVGSLERRDDRNLPVDGLGVWLSGTVCS